MPHTNASVLTSHGYSTENIEFPELHIPVETGIQRQGDVLILPTLRTAKGSPIGRCVEVVRSEQGSNTHTLHGEGEWEASPNAATDLVQGWLSVPEGGEAFLIHSEEHSALGIGPGNYEIRRQREFAGEWRRVAD